MSLVNKQKYKTNVKTNQFRKLHLGVEALKNLVARPPTRQRASLLCFSCRCAAPGSDCPPWTQLADGIRSTAKLCQQRQEELAVLLEGLRLEESLEQTKAAPREAKEEVEKQEG